MKGQWKWNERANERNGWMNEWMDLVSFLLSLLSSSSFCEAFYLFFIFIYLYSMVLFEVLFLGRSIIYIYVSTIWIGSVVIPSGVWRYQTTLNVTTRFFSKENGIRVLQNTQKGRQKRIRRKDGYHLR
ncbi:hypothetical protein B0H63DRAFT_157427 [Podospora didyma]|uniref:Transmembrane protein n=1 Tax=Podospora didyma TaxID=330526 RepID=A0AAE0NTM1_9PEZI|nr:hypothetical protein B0H63DRAFT_157427 [Podospora didyma]